MSLNTIFYCIFYLLGYLSMKCKFTNIKSFIFVEAIVISLFIIALHYNNLQIADLQILKSEGSYIYVLASLISCLLVIYLKDKIKCDSLIFKPINFIGKNALYLFFSQGLSSSTFFIILMLVYKLVDIIINKLKKVGWLRLENFIISNDK